MLLFSKLSAFSTPTWTVGLVVVSGGFGFWAGPVIQFNLQILMVPLAPLLCLLELNTNAVTRKLLKLSCLDRSMGLR